MQNSSRTLEEILSNHELFLPGSNVRKTYICMLFVLILLLFLTDNLIFCANIPAIKPYQKFSILLLFFSGFFAVWSANSVFFTLKRAPKEIAKYKYIYTGKVLLELSVLLFFLVVCLWVLVLGGVMYSPFASLLSISPILLSIQYFHDRATDYDTILETLRPHWNNVSDEDLTRSHGVAKRVISSLGVLPIGIVVFTLVGGQIWISYFDGNLLLLGKGFQEVIVSTWYRKVYYCIFYMSVVIAAFGIYNATESPQWISKRKTL